MDYFAINGGKPLRGTVTVEGSKNAALPIVAGALLIAKGKTTLTNIPPLRDMSVMSKVMAALGAKVSYDEEAQTMDIDASHLGDPVTPYDLMSQMRGSFVVLGPLLARLGRARVSLPGGCSLGARPVDYHIKGLQAMGAIIDIDGGDVVATMPKTAKRGTGSVVYFDRPTHTGTENLIFAATLGKGETMIHNAACDPEVVDVANFINAAGGRVEGAGTPIIRVKAVRSLNAVKYKVSGDRLVAGTYLFGAAATGGKIEVRGVDPAQLTIVFEKLREMGCAITGAKTSIKLTAPKRLKSASVVTFPFPGFPTDLQPCIMAAMAVADGTSRLRETIFEDRFSHAMEMRRLGADITISADEAFIQGVDRLSGATVMASDIRAGAGLVLAALASRKQSEVKRVYHIDRGYAHLEERLRELGADIERKQE